MISEMTLTLWVSVGALVIGIIDLYLWLRLWKESKKFANWVTVIQKFTTPEVVKDLIEVWRGSNATAAVNIKRTNRRNGTNDTK